MNFCSFSKSGRQKEAARIILAVYRMLQSQFIYFLLDAMYTSSYGTDLNKSEIANLRMEFREKLMASFSRGSVLRGPYLRSRLPSQTKDRPGYRNEGFGITGRRISGGRQGASETLRAQYKCPYGLRFLIWSCACDN